MKNKVLTDEVKSFFSRHSHLKKVTVALSGGCDSVALLASLRSVLGAENISAVHVNHGIRGDEADRDEEFCICLCEKLGIPLEIYRYPIPDLAKADGVGLEECARKYRYRALKLGCEKFGSDAVATAHNANDNAESLIFNLCRGTGLGGASGIPTVRDENGMTVIRPILPVLRSQIVEYVGSMGLSYVTDSTNSDTAYTRNYIRSKIIPELNAINEKAVLNILSCTRIIDGADGFITETANGFISSQRLSGDTFYISKEKFAALHRAVKSAVLCNIYTKLSGEALNSSLVDSCLSFIEGSEPGSCLNLPFGIDIFDCGESFSVSPRRSKSGYTVKLNEGINVFSQQGFNIVLLKDPDENFILNYKNIYEFVKWSILNTDMINGDLFAKRRTDGDRITAGGMSRKPKNLLADKKIPHDKRICYPMIYDSQGTVCIPGCAVKDGYDGRGAEHKTYVIYTSVHGRSEIS